MNNKYVIIIAGKMRSGKNTFADIFETICCCKGYTVKKDSFASVLKDICSTEFQGLIDYLNKFTDEVKANVPIFSESRFDTIKQSIDKVVDKIYTKKENWFEEKNVITRLILQIVGTNLFRKYIDDDHWVKEFIKKVKNYNEKFVIVTDARFPNEIDMVHKFVEDRRVISINIERETGIKSTHLSETALDKFLWFDYVIDNNSNLNTLVESVKTTIKDIEEQENSN